MKERKRTTMPAAFQANAIEVSEGHKIIFDKLIGMLTNYANHLDIRVHTNTQYELWTRHTYRTGSFHPRNRKGVLFAGIAVYPKYIGLYFYALHINEGLKDFLADELKALLKGKSTFRIKNLSDALAVQIQELFDAGWKFYQKQGWV